MGDYHLVVSCEHGGNEVPECYRPLFEGSEDLLQTHRGWDIGILPLARRLAEGLGADLHAATVTRLLIDLNRSVRNRTLFSEFSRGLSSGEKEAIVAKYYRPYRDAVEADVARGLARERPVLHLSIHSFTPELRGDVRRADLGLLYDPSRPPERDFCRQWQIALGRKAPELRVLRNSPYRGVSDSLVSFLHRRYAPERYLGVELEVNQRFPAGDPLRWQKVQQALLQSLRTLLFPNR